VIEVIDGRIMPFTGSAVSWVLVPKGRSTSCITNGVFVVVDEYHFWLGKMARRLTEHVTEYQRSGEHILKREHQIPFIGSIGIGKLTASAR
jgi:hypothetical protein